MGSNDNQWQQMAALIGIASLAGAGMGAGSALMFAERRAGAQDREIVSLFVAGAASGIGAPRRSRSRARAWSSPMDRRECLDQREDEW